LLFFVLLVTLTLFIPIHLNKEWLEFIATDFDG